MNSINIRNLLERLIAIPSPFFQEEEITHFLESFLLNMGFDVERQPVKRKVKINGKEQELMHFNLLAEKGDGDRSFLLYGHMDTVPVMNAWFDMAMDPFKPVYREGKLFGLGSADMKGGLTAILKAVENIQPKDYKIKICFGVDEENESMGAFTLIKSDFLKDCQGCIVPEVGSGRAEPAYQNLVIGRHGRNRVGVRIRGKAAHASTPEFIINPVEYALEFIQETGKLSLGDDADMPMGNVSIGGIYAESGGLSSPEDCVIWFDNLYSPPMKSPDIFNQYAYICRELNSKYKVNGFPHFSLIDIQNPSERDGQLFGQRVTPFMEPWKIDINHPLVQCGKAVVQRITGKTAVLTCGKSNADENYIGQAVPTLGVPPIGGNEHQGGEYVLLESLDNCARIMNGIITAYMG